MSERLWRCAECGKWSHAQRQPKRHLRFVQNEGQGAPPDNKVHEVVEAVYSHVNGTESDGGWFVYCGPFEAWTAEREQVPV